MSGFVLLFSSLTLLVAAVSWWLSRRTAAPAPAPSPSASPCNGQDLLPGADSADGKTDLAAFYAYQLAVSRINRT